MDRRVELHKKLVGLIGNNNVYFQPPASVQLVYPCIIYSMGNGSVKRADDRVYSYTNSYEIIFIYRKQNNAILDKMLTSFDMCSVSRVYVVDNLYHYAFTLYF